MDSTSAGKVIAKFREEVGQVIEVIQVCAAKKQKGEAVLWLEELREIRQFWHDESKKKLVNDDFTLSKKQREELNEMNTERVAMAIERVSILDKKIIPEAMAIIKTIP